ncbi:hypothetical protein ACS8E3_01995 [Psychrobacter sp. 2Y5]|uniref:hypothetical protein n=1 Tax=unclassified Psychrobacter TaxID=196806 RepID=UPI003F4754F4
MSNHPSVSIDTPASRLVTIDSLYLRVMNDRVRDICINTEHLAIALEAIKTEDDVSQGVLVAIKAALLANSELARLVNEMFCDYALPYQAEVSSHE